MIKFIDEALAKRNKCLALQFISKTSTSRVFHAKKESQGQQTQWVVHT